ncbi:MAG TPA: hypothetical protein VG078_06760 [Acidimicrobiales bacterium]|nr:hypothetical protein [Acidimicrobiales bacterium]
MTRLPVGRRSVAPFAAPLLVAAAVCTAGGAYVHLREWLALYRHLPATIPGSAVVRVGFPLHAVMAGGLAVLLLFCALRGGRLVRYVVGGTLAFQFGAVAALVVSRTGSLFGWSEATWTGGATEALLTALGAIASLGAALVVGAVERRRLFVPSARVKAGSRSYPGRPTPTRSRRPMAR